MKKMLYKIISALMVVIMVLPSCKKDFEAINTDPINSPTTTAAQLLAPALVSTLAANMNRNRSFNNELMQVTVSISDGDATVFRYEYRSTISDYLWNSWYIQLTNFKDMHTQASDPATLNTSYQGISLICQSWIYSLLTDTYGDVPYFKSNQAKNGIVEAPFDRQKDIYLDIFKKLEEANTLLTANTSIDPISDPMFHGDIEKWRKLGNSLYLRLLLRVSGKSEVATEAIAKIKEIIDTNPTKYPVMEDNDDTAVLKWTGSGAYISPNYTNIRAQDFRSPAIASFFAENLRTWSDPRIDPAYGRDGVNRWGIAQGKSGIAGVPSGYIPGTGVAKESYFYSYDQTFSSKPALSLQNDPMTGLIMNYAELQFILAEAASKGWISSNTDEHYYNTGILNSITYWIPDYATDINDPVFKKYVTEADLTWMDGLPEEEMERIHLQKYYAMFLVDLQQWFEYRRTGYPDIPKGPGLRNGSVMPARMTYPVYVQSANPTNYDLAVTAQGPDVISTEVWWQKP